jgi:hypothetical protein
VPETDTHPIPSAPIPSPWGPRTGEPSPTFESNAAPAPRSRLTSLAWGAVSTLILAIWVGLWVGPLGALALVGGVFVHEFGHLLVINWAGAGPSSIRIIPFLGGAASMRRAPDSDFKGVLIALAGPAFGLLAALPFALVGEFSGQKGWLVGVFYVGALNLINLAPAAPLDGAKALGPVLGRIHPWLERVVLLVIAGLVLVWALFSGNWLFALVVALGAVRAVLMTRDRPPSRPLSLVEWLGALALYAVVVALCAAVTLWAIRAGGVQPQQLLLRGQS